MLSASVVVSCYNQAPYIEECLDSILNQSINFECEVIVSDDCSTDDTQAILRAYAKKHEAKIRLLLRDKNVGAALNYHGVHGLAKGDIVFHFDGDDVMLPGKLQSQYDIFSEYPDVNLVLHKATYFSDDGSYSSNTRLSNDSATGFFFFSLAELARWGSVAVHSSYTYRRSSRKTKIEREFMEWFFAMDSLIPNGRGAYLNTEYVKYRCNPSGSSYLSTRAGKIKSYNLYLDDLYFYFAHIKTLRQDLYANFLVTFLTMFKSTRTCTWKSVRFLLVNLPYFRVSKFAETVRVRSKVGPALAV